MATKVFISEDAGGKKLPELKEKIVDLINNNEGITNDEIASKLNLDVSFVDALLAELQRANKVRLY